VHVTNEAAETYQAQGRNKVWEYRWRELKAMGLAKRRSKIVGSIEDYPNESLAQAALDGLRLNINQLTTQQVKDISVGALVNHYREHELPDIFFKDEPDRISDDESRKSWSTQDTYDGYLRKWILPRWRSHRLSEVKAVAVEQWLKTLSFENGDSAGERQQGKD
jgi:hypothetical protein